MGGDRIEFQVPGITDIGASTRGQQAAWDELWEKCKRQITAAAAEALDRATGSGLDDRTIEYHQKSVLYSQGVGQQAQSVQQIGQIATETNANMVRAIRG